MDPKDTPDIPDNDTLLAGALALLERHFAALEAGDLQAFRETAHLFPANSGLPFERWWAGMRSLTPLKVKLTPGHVSPGVAAYPEPHMAVWVHAAATSTATGRPYEGDFVVWYLLAPATYKLGCRLHWWLEEARSAG